MDSTALDHVTPRPFLFPVPPPLFFSPLLISLPHPPLFPSHPHIFSSTFAAFSLPFPFSRLLSLSLPRDSPSPPLSSPPFFSPPIFPLFTSDLFFLLPLSTRLLPPPPLSGGASLHLLLLPQDLRPQSLLPQTGRSHPSHVCSPLSVAPSLPPPLFSVLFNLSIPFSDYYITVLLWFFFIILFYSSFSPNFLHTILSSLMHSPPNLYLPLFFLHLTQVLEVGVDSRSTVHGGHKCVLYVQVTATVRFIPFLALLNSCYCYYLSVTCSSATAFLFNCYCHCHRCCYCD